MSSTYRSSLATSSVPAPLSSRPRRSVVHRPPSPRAAESALRRSSDRTTASSLTRSGLPGPVVAEAGVPLVEVASYVLVALALSVPLLLWTGFSLVGLLLAAALLAFVSYALWARRVVAGDEYVAVRRLGRFHVARAGNVRHLELSPSSQGSLCLHMNDGNCMRIRRVEFESPALNSQLRLLAAGAAGTLDRRTAELLGVEPSGPRIADRYYPAVPARPGS